MAFDWSKKPTVTLLHGGSGIQIHTHEDPGHEVRVLDGHWAVDAIDDLHRRICSLEQVCDETPRACSDGRKDELDELERRVDKLAEWVRQCHRNWADDSSGKHQAEYTLMKMCELGLVKHDIKLQLEFGQKVVPK
jgi:hypothetical protein